MKTNSRLAGHILSLLTMLVWGTTYISTKILLGDFTPLQILMFRFLVAIVILFLLYPRLTKFMGRKKELVFACAGLCGICLYYLLENIALIYTSASNVGVIISMSPFFSVLISRIRKTDSRTGIKFFAGFFVSMAGICLISFGKTGFSFNARGDLLALLAAVVWALYSAFTEEVGRFGLHPVQATRHIFFYGILFMVPLCILFGKPSVFSMELWPLFLKPANMANLLFLGVLASAVCFVTWTQAVKCIGAVASGIYIYIVPAVTVASSVIILHEELTPVKVAGSLMAVAGLVISRSDT